MDNVVSLSSTFAFKTQVTHLWFLDSLDGSKVTKCHFVTYLANLSVLNYIFETNEPILLKIETITRRDVLSIVLKNHNLNVK